MKKLIFIAFFLMLAIGVYAAPSQCYYSPNNTIVTIDNGIEVLRGENLRCNDTTVTVTGNITVRGNFTLSNFGLFFEGRDNDGQYNFTAFPGSNVTIGNQTNITSLDPDHEYFFVISNDVNFTMRDSYLSEVGWTTTTNKTGPIVYASNSTIINNTFSHNYHGIILWNSFYDTFINNTAFIADKNGFYFYNTSYLTVRNCTSLYGLVGIHIVNMLNSTIEDSRIGFTGKNLPNDGDNWIMYSSYNNTIRNNSVYSSNDLGFYMSGSSNNTIENMEIYNNSNGIKIVAYNNENRFNNITIYNNTYGISIQQSYDNIFTNISILNSTGWDINSLIDANSTYYNITFNNTVTASFIPTNVSIKNEPNPPANTTGLLSLDAYLNVTNISEYVSWLSINLTYNESKAGYENNISLYRYDGTNWLNISSTVDAANNYVYGNITSFSIFGALEDTFDCIYHGGNWYIRPGKNCTVVNQSLQLTGNLSIYGNLTLSDVDMLVNLTNVTPWRSYLNGVGYNLNQTSSWIRVFSGGLLNVTNFTNITSNESFGNFWCGYEMVAFNGSIFQSHDSFYRHVGCNNRSDYISGVIGFAPEWTRFHGLRVETDNARLINNTFEVNASWGINLWNSSNNWAENNTITGVGVTAYGGGVIITNFWGGLNNTVFNNTIIDVHHGEYLWSAINNTISNNTVYKTKDQDQQYGVLLYNYSINNTVENNTIFNLTNFMSSGMWLQGASNNHFKWNHISNNTAAFTEVSSTANNGNEFHNNTIIDSGNTFQSYGENNTFSNNYLLSTTTSVSIVANNSNTIENNTLITPIGEQAVIEANYGNKINNNNLTGPIMIASTGGNNNITNNRLTSSTLFLSVAQINGGTSIVESNSLIGPTTSPGIYISGPGTVLVRYNNATSCDYGIQITGTGNYIFTNNTIINSSSYDYYDGSTDPSNTTRVYNLTINNTLMSFTGYGINIREVKDVDLPANTTGLLKMDYSYLTVASNILNSWIYLNLSYNESKAIEENRVGMFSYSSSWNYFDYTLDATNNYVYGNISSFSTIAALENTQPLVTIQYPENTTYYVSSVWENVTASIAGRTISWCRASMNGTANQTLTNLTGNWNFKRTELANGLHNITFFCSDSTGNITQTEVLNFTVDVAPPVRSAGSPSDTVASSETIMSVTTDRSAVCRYATDPNIVYGSMSHDTTPGTIHTWGLTELINGASYAYYIRCNDGLENINTNDYPINFTVSYSGPPSGGGISPGQCTGDVCPGVPIPTIQPTPDPGQTEDEVSASQVSIGQQFRLPAGGKTIKINDKINLNIFGDSATLNNLTQIDPNEYKILFCNQSYVDAYEINVTVDNAYICFDTGSYDLSALSIYKFKEDWNELENITKIGDKICGKITSTPYMIAGFKTSPDQQRSLEEITIANDKIDELKKIMDVTESEELIKEAEKSYFECDYQTSFSLAQKALQSIPVSLPEVSLLVWVPVVAVLFGIFIFYKHQNVENELRSLKNKLKEKIIKKKKVTKVPQNPQRVSKKQPNQGKRLSK